jgi:hypothetical protein
MCIVLQEVATSVMQEPSRCIEFAKKKQVTKEKFSFSFVQEKRL